MAMIKCPECSADVSDSALKCPSCGVQLRKPKRGFFGKLVKWGFIGFNILMAIWPYAAGLTVIALGRHLSFAASF